MRELVFDPRDFDASKVLSHEKIRFVVIPLLFITAISSLLGQGPFGGAEGQQALGDGLVDAAVVADLRVAAEEAQRDARVGVRQSPLHFHDLLADTGKEGVMDDIQAWIDAHMPK